MSLMTGMLHHVEIYVSDLERSKTFYHWLLIDKLGYHISAEWDAGISYKKGDTYIVFVQTEEKYQDVTYHRCRTGLNHLAFHGGNLENIDELTEELKAMNIPILYEDKHPYAGGPNYYAVFFEDPDRIKLEVVASGK